MTKDWFCVLEPVADILARLEKTEGDYLKGYSELKAILQ